MIYRNFVHIIIWGSGTLGIDEIWSFLRLRGGLTTNIFIIKFIFFIGKPKNTYVVKANPKKRR